MKLAANWIMGDIAAYLKNEKLTIREVKLTPQELSELIASIKGGTISGKIGKQVNFHLLKNLSSSTIPYIHIYVYIYVFSSFRPLRPGMHINGSGIFYEIQCPPCKNIKLMLANLLTAKAFGTWCR